MQRRHLGIRQSGKGDVGLTRLDQFCLNKTDIRPWRAVVAPAQQTIHRRFFPLDNRLDARVRQVSHPTGDVKCLGDQAHGFAKANALYASGNEHVDRNDVHSSALMALLRVVLTTARVFFSPMRRSLDARVGLVARRFLGM